MLTDLEARFGQPENRDPIQFFGITFEVQSATPMEWGVATNLDVSMRAVKIYL